MNKIKGMRKVRPIQVDGPEQDPASDPLAGLPVQPAEQADDSTTPGDLSGLDLPVDKTPVEDLHEQLAGSDPDHNAKVLNLAKQTGEHPAFIDKNLPQVQRAANAPGPDFFQVMKSRYPESSDWASVPEHMAVAHDDLQNVVGHEDTVQQARMASSFLEEGRAAWQHSLGGLLTGKPTLENDPSAPWYDKFASIPASLAGDLPFMIGGGLAGAAGGTLAAGPVGTFVGGAAGGFGAPAAAKKGLLDYYAKGGPKDAGELADRATEILKEFGKQTAVGMAVQATGGAAGVVAGKAALGTAATTALKLGTEAGTLEVAGKGVEGEKPTWGGFIENLATIGGMHAFGALPPVEAAKTAIGKAALSVMGDAAKESKLRARSPEAYEKLVDQLTDGGKVFIPVQAADAYFQGKGMDPAKFMGELGAGDSYAVAKQTGNDIEIPLSQWLSKVSPTEHFQGLLDHTRMLDPETMTVEEAKQRQADHREKFQAILDAREKAQEEADAGVDGEYTPKVPTVFNDRYEQLRAAGMSDFEARHNAIIHDSIVSTLATRFGMTPEALGQEIKLEVVKGEAPDTSFNFGANAEGEATAAAQTQEDITNMAREQAGQLGDVLQQSKEDRVALARKALEAIPDLHKDDAAEAFGLHKLEVRKLRGVSERQGRGTYSKEEIHKAAGVEKSFAGGTASFDQGPWKAPDKSPNGEAFDKEVKIHEADAARILDRDGKFSAKAAKEFADSEFKGKTFTNLQSGLEIEFNSKGLKKAQGRIHSRIDAIAHTNLDKLLENAQYMGREPDRYNRPEVKGVDVFWAPMRAEGKDYLVKILARETDGKRIYDQVSVERELGFGGNKEGRPGTLPDGASEEVLRSGASERPSGLSIADFMGEISQAKQEHSYLQPGESSPRGRILISGKEFRVDLFKGADRSTFIHETGHMFLEVMKSLSEREDAPEQIKKDFSSIREWLGLKDGEAIGSEHHEQWARGFEAYLMEGKAPSEGLAKTFSVFRRWLINVYKTMRNLNVELSPDIRGVMDRMLATDEEIKRAAALSGYEAPELPDVPEEVRGKIRDLQQRARDQAEAQLLKQQMKEVTAEHRLALDIERQRLEGLARPEVEKLPIFEAIRDLSFDGEKSRNATAIAERGLRGDFTPEEATHFEVVAETHGFASGQDLAEQIVDAKESNLFEREVRARVNEGLKAHADLKDTALIREKALEAIHSTRTTELLALERDALAKLVSDKTERAQAAKLRKADAKLEAAAAKDAAKAFLEGKPTKESGNFRRYITAERRAAERASRALAKKDYEAATQAKREQLLNHALAAEAMKNKAEIDNTARRLTDMARKDLLEKMPYAFSRQVDQLLARFGFQERKPEDSATLTAIAKDMLAKGEDPAEIANKTGMKQDAQGRLVQESLSDFVARVNDSYIPLSLPEFVLAGGEKHFKELTLSELRQVKEAAQAVSSIGRAFDKYLELRSKMSVKEAAREFRAGVEKEYGTPMAESQLPGSKHASKVQELLHAISNVPAAFDRMLDTISTTCRKLDGLKDGPAQENIARPLQAASDRKILRTHAVVKEVEEVFGQHYDPKELAEYREKRIQTGTRADGSPEYFTKEQILSMALNWGNEGNRQRLMDGFGFNEAKMQSLFQHLDKKDWDFAQATWDHLQKYWPEIVKLEMDVNGFEPKGVEAAAFQNDHGEYKGGYYPIAYDFEKSTDAYQNQLQKDALYKVHSTARAMTDQGHTEARASAVNRPLRLSLDVLRDHHENVIHDLEFRRAVIDVNRFLMQKDVKAGIVNALGVRGYQGIQEWLKSAASPPSEPLSFGEQAARWFRFRTTMFMMAYNLKSLPRIGAENVVNLSSELGVPGAARALKNYWLGGSGIHEMVMEKSPFMMERATHLDRDQADLTETMRGEKASAFRKYAFAVHAVCDQAVSLPLWHDVYTREIGLGTDEKAAITKADEAVRRTFMSGAETNQSLAMRGTEKTKFLTIAFGYQSMMWNRFSEQKFAAGKAWEQGNHAQAALIAARATAYTFIMPALVTALSRELLRNSLAQGNQDDRMKRMAASAIEEATPLKFVPILRDAQTWFVKKSLGEHTSDLQVSPLEGAAETLLTPAAELFHSALTHKPLPDKFAEHVVNSVSFTAGVPKSTNDLVFNFIDWQKTHGQATWKDFVARRTKK